MKFFKFIFKILMALLKVVIAIAGINMIFSYIEERKHDKTIDGGNFFIWKYGRIFYHKRGHGSPVLLIHGLEPAQSGRNLDTLSKVLSVKHTVYTIDLLGFGLSDKPWITYTNFLYVRLVLDFIKEVIGDYTDIVACDGSALSMLQAYNFDSSTIGKVLLVNPSRKETVQVPKAFALKLKKVLDLPLIGTFIYNLYSLTGAAPFDKEGRHVFASRLSGHLTSDITTRPDLMKPEIIVFDQTENEKEFTFGDIGTALI